MSHWKAHSPTDLTVPKSAETLCQVNQIFQPPASISPFSFSGVQPFPIMTADSLVSPHDPAFLEGASSSARFGLDIGGTLCKVVYFEPTADFLKDNPRTQKTTTCKGNAGHLARTDPEAEKTDSNGEFVSRRAYSSDLYDKARKGSPKDELKRNSLSMRMEEENATELVLSDVDESAISSHTAVTSQLKASEQTEDLKTFRKTCAEDELNSRTQVRKIWVSSHEPVHLPGRGTLYFKCFETCLMEEFLNLTKEHRLVTSEQAIGGTGGGVRKFGDQFLEIAGLHLQKADELKSLVRGIDFLARHAQQEIFEYPPGSYKGGIIQRPWASPENSSNETSDVSSGDEDRHTPCLEEPAMGSEAGTSQIELLERKNRVKKSPGSTVKGPALTRLDSAVRVCKNELLYPYIVVNIGSGVSILQVDSADKFERVGGTSLGGSTFLGLAAALTGCTSFKEAISLAMRGDSTQVDMLIGDIYGGDYTEMNLAATTVASSFGKLVQPGRSSAIPEPEHLAKAALLMVTNNIGSIAWLHARNLGVGSIMFTGSFLHNNKLAMRLLAVAMEFWSKGKTKALFLRHEGHAGAVGALLSALDASNPLDGLLLK